MMISSSNPIFCLLFRKILNIWSYCKVIYVFFFKFCDLKCECLHIFLWGLWDLTVTVREMSICLCVPACECHGKGSLSDVCHPETGLCSCRARVTGQQCDQCLVRCLPSLHAIKVSVSLSIIDTLTSVQIQGIRDCCLELRPQHNWLYCAALSRESVL